MELDFKHMLEALEHFQRHKKVILERIDRLVEQWKKEDENGFKEVED